MKRKNESKKRSTAIALLCKRKKFRTVFWQKWLMIFVITALAYVIGVTFFVTYKKNELKHNYYRAQGHNVQYFTSLSQKFEEQQFANQAQFRLAMMAESKDFYSLLRDPESHEIVAGCEERLFTFHRTDEEENTRVLICDLKEIPGWTEYRQKVQSYNKRSVMIYEMLEIKDLYVNGDFFLPGPIKIHTSAVNIPKALLLNDYLEKELFSIELEGAHTIPSEYQKDDMSYVLLKNPVLVGYSDNSPYLSKNKSSDEAYQFLMDYYEDRNTNPESSGWYENEGYFWIKIVSDMDVELVNGQKVSMLGVAYLDITENYGEILLGIAIVVLLLCTLLSWFWAKLFYARLKLRYDVEDYRRNLMNTMAHDLRSPLMSISGYAENLRDNLYTEKREYYSQAILNNVQYMNRMIESVLHLSKSENGSLILKKERIEVSELLKRGVEHHKEELEKKGLQIEMTGTVSMEADPLLFEQVLCNLLDNAVKYASNNSTICVMMKENEISFRNSCNTDLRDVKDTLCQPFVVGDDSRSNRRGCGLGLAIAKNICQLYGFNLEIVCEKESFEAKIVK